MNNQQRRTHWILAALLAAALAPATAAGAAQDTPATLAAHASANDGASAARMPLRWELLRNLFDASAPEGRSEARLVLTNGDSRPLPAGHAVLWRFAQASFMAR